MVTPRVGERGSDEGMHEVEAEATAHSHRPELATASRSRPGMRPADSPAALGVQEPTHDGRHS